MTDPAVATEPRNSETLTKLLGYFASMHSSFHTRYAGEAFPVPVPSFSKDFSGAIRSQPAALGVAGNPSSLMSASWSLVNGCCTTEPFTVNLDTLTMEQTARAPVLFRSQYAIFSEPDDFAASVRREFAPQCSISLGSLSAALFNHDLPLYESHKGQARASLEQYTNRIHGVGLPWTSGNLQDTYADLLEERMAVGLVNVDITNRELAKSLIRSWMRALCIWVATDFRLPSVADAMCVPYPTDLTRERPQLERMVAELSVIEYRRILRMVYDTAKVILTKLCIFNVDRFGTAFMRAHPTSLHEWVETAEKICCDHFMHIMQRYLTLRYYDVGVFFDAANAMARYIACPEPVAMGSFMPTIQTNTRHLLDRQEYEQFQLSFPDYHSGKAKHAVARASELTHRDNKDTDRHERVQLAFYVTQRTMHTECMISACRMLESVSDPTQLSYPIAGAQALLAALVLRYLLIVYIMPSLVPPNTAGLLQTIDLDAFRSASLVLPDSAHNVRGTLLSYAQSVKLDVSSVQFGEKWTSMLDGLLPDKILARNPSSSSEDGKSLLPVIEPAPDAPAAEESTPAREMDVDSPPAKAKKSPAKKTRGTKRAAASLAEVSVVSDAESVGADESNESDQDGGDSDNEDDDEEDESETRKTKDPAKPRKTRSHKCEASRVKARLRRRQDIVKAHTTKKLGEISQLLTLRQTELNTTGVATLEMLPGKKMSPGANSERSQQRTRISDTNMRWRTGNRLHFFSVRSVYRTAHTGPTTGKSIPPSGLARRGGLREVLKPLPTPFPDTLLPGMSRIEHLPKLCTDQDRGTVQPDPSDEEAMNILFQSIKQNTVMCPASFERDKRDKTTKSPVPLYSLRQIYAMLIYYVNHCQPGSPQITATPNRHTNILAGLGKMFGFEATGRTARVKVFSVLKTSPLYPISTDTRASPIMQPAQWLALMYTPFLHISDAPIQ